MSRMVLVAAGLLIVQTAAAQQPARISYTLAIDSADLSGFAVDMSFRIARDSFTLAAAAHPEYDDKYWRHLENLSVTDAGGKAAQVERVDSVLWRVRGVRGAVAVHYRIRLPDAVPMRSAWKPFLAPTGGLVGGPHSFLYVVGAEAARADVALVIPRSWRVATGMSAARASTTFTASDIYELMESPFFVGRFSDWRFDVAGTPHRVVYWRAPGATPFDTTTLVRAIESFARETIRFFGSVPYRDYTFILQDDAVGGLEHPNSVTIGAPSARLAQDPYAQMAEIAHEFFHTWNLMQIRPAEYRRVDYRTQPPVAGLWFSEGLTIYYADELRRRAGLPTGDSTRVARLEGLIARYLSSPGNARFSAEHVSRVAYNAPPGSLGNYGASAHLQGEIIGRILDIIIRAATSGARSMDDVMRLMLTRFSGDRGFTSSDVEQAVSDICGCSVKPFFDTHVRSGNPIDFDRYLALAGQRLQVEWVPSVNDRGEPYPDLRIGAWQPPDSLGLSLLSWHPESSWTRAGLNTGDRLVSINDQAIRTSQQMRDILTGLRIGDTAHVRVARAGRELDIEVRIAGFERPVARIETRDD